METEIIPMQDTTVTESNEIIPMQDTTVTETEVPLEDNIDKVDSLVANIAMTYEAEPDAAMEISKDMIKASSVMYSELGDPIDVLNSVYTPQSFEWSSENIKPNDPEIVEQDYEDRVVKKSQLKIKDELEKFAYADKFMDKVPQQYKDFLAEEYQSGRSYSDTVKELQRHAGVVADGWLGKDTVKALQGQLPIKEDLITLDPENTVETPTDIEGITKYDTMLFKSEGEVRNEAGLHVQYPSLEGGLDTIARGHKITPSEAKSGKIHGIDYTKGLTEEQAATIYKKDKLKATKDLGLEKAPEEVQYLALDVAHRAGNIKGWKFLKALKAKDFEEAYAQLGDMYWTKPNGEQMFYNSRNLEIFNNIGYTPTKEAQEKYDKLQAAARAKWEKKNK